VQDDAAFPERVDRPDRLVARHDRETGKIEVAFNDVQIGPATTARTDTHTHFAGARLR
jgi:hypothetical protein